MADVTNLFKAQVKALKLRNKSISDDKIRDPPSSILPKRHDSDFQHKAKKLVQTISKLRNFLLENRKSYVNSGSLLGSQGTCMSESERDQIDDQAQGIIKSCRDTIMVFRVETDKQKVHPQVKEHRHSVMILVEAYLKAICKVYSEQKAVRVKRVVDRKKISKLEPERKYNHLTKQQLKKNLNIDQSSSGKENVDPSENSADLQPNSPAIERRPPQSAVYEDTPDYSVEEGMSPEEAQLFEQENQALYAEMNSMSEEVKQIESQVVEVAKLQEIFTEKILEQDVQMNQIATTVVGTTENIKDANEEIRDAIKKKAEFRVVILFFLVVMSFSLLFLDWYNN